MAVAAGCCGYPYVIVAQHLGGSPYASAVHVDLRLLRSNGASAARSAACPAQGYIDVMDLNGDIIDVKTASKKPSGVRADYSVQIATYAALAPALPGGCACKR